MFDAPEKGSTVILLDNTSASTSLDTLSNSLRDNSKLEFMSDWGEQTELPSWCKDAGVSASVSGVVVKGLGLE